MLERKEQIQQILQALSPERDRIIFEQEVARIYDVSPGEAEQIVNRVRTQIKQQLP